MSNEEDLVLTNVLRLLLSVMKREEKWKGKCK